MTNEVATSGSALPANVLNMAKALATSAADAGAGSGGEVYLRFSKGDWSYGVEEQEPEEGSLWAINPLQCEHGWIAWGREGSEQAGRVLGERMVSATQPLPDVNDLPDVGGTWTKMIGLQLRCMSGTDKGLQVVFKSNSLGGRQLYDKVLKAIVSRIESEAPDIVPVVTLEADSYKNKTYGKIWTPQMNIQKWVTMDGLEAPAALEEQADEAPDTPAPTRRTRAAS